MSQNFMVALVTILLAWSTASADEGMWTLDNLPKKDIKAKYGFDVTDAWTKKVMQSSVRLGGGCSGSLVSPDGLVMTNHHCARSCIFKISSATNDYLSNGFNAKKQSDEKQCPATEVSRLIEIQDVTDSVKKSLAGLDGKAYSDKLKELTANLEKSCATDPVHFRCELISLYRGGRYNLYKYNRYQDVRLVFAPEGAMGHFGGDPDNFNFPRYSLDFAFLRIYENGKPLKSDQYFGWSATGGNDGELTFITGHPGSTQRLLTVAQLEYLRDKALPKSIELLSERRGMLLQYQKIGKEEKRRAAAKLAYTENSLKAIKGRAQALRDPVFFGKIKKEENDFKEKVLSSRANRKKYGEAWNEMAKVVKAQEAVMDEYQQLGFNDFGSTLFVIAQDLLRAPVEKQKPNEKRLQEFTDSRLPVLEQALFSPEPIYNDLEILELEADLVKMREVLGPDHPYVKLVLGKSSPEDLAKKLVNGTKLKNVDVRKKLYAGGSKAVDASKDPMIEFARKIDGEARNSRLHYEEEIEAKINRLAELIAEARFEVYGTDVYPDATSSLRVSYGQVKGLTDKGKTIPPVTYTKGLYERQTGSDPFKISSSWLAAEKNVNPSTIYNFISTNDIIGGNSGSPVINKNAEIVGLVFDGNIHSLGGAYGYDGNLNRAVSVNSKIIQEALKNVYKSNISL